MPSALVIRPRAQADVDAQASDYQRSAEPGAAARFLAELRQVLERVVRFPQLGPPWPTPTRELTGVRRRLLPHFPYSVFYLPTETTLEVVRVLHNSRDLPPLLEDL